jgi:hypothetical protein
MTKRDQVSNLQNLNEAMGATESLSRWQDLLMGIKANGFASRWSWWIEGVF